MIWLGSSIPKLSIDNSPTDLTSIQTEISLLADVFTIHDPLFVKQFTDTFKPSLDECR